MAETPRSTFTAEPEGNVGGSGDFLGFVLGLGWVGWFWFLILSDFGGCGREAGRLNPGGAFPNGVEVVLATGALATGTAAPCGVRSR